MPEAFLTKLGPIQHALRRSQLAGWLLADHGHNRVARMLLQSRGRPRRRYVFWVPAEGFPITLAHRLDAAAVERFPGESWEYEGWADFREQLRRLLPREKRIALEYAPMGSHPYLDQVDGGFIELLKSYGVFPVSSGDLLAEFLGPLPPQKIAAHRDIAAGLEEMVAKVISRLQDDENRRAEPVGSALQIVKEDADARGFELAHANAFVSEHADQEKYLQIDLAAHSGGASAEIARTIGLCVEPSAPVLDAYATAHSSFEVLHGFLTSRLEQGRTTMAFETDQLVRNHFANQGIQRPMDHRLGHALGAVTPLGEAGLLDSFEVVDTRPIFPQTAWALRPSVRVEELRVQTSACLLINEGKVEWTSLPPRRLESLV